LGGCNPFASNSINSCRPNPICEDATVSDKLLSDCSALMNAISSTPSKTTHVSCPMRRSSMGTRLHTVSAPFFSFLLEAKPHPLLQDFVVDKGNIMNTNSSGGELAMLLTQDNGGTRLSSTRYIYYGTITATRELDIEGLLFVPCSQRCCSENWSMGRCRHSFYHNE